MQRSYDAIHIESIPIRWVDWNQRILLLRNADNKGVWAIREQRVRGAVLRVVTLLESRL